MQIHIPEQGLRFQVILIKSVNFIFSCCNPPYSDSDAGSSAGASAPSDSSPTKSSS